MFKFIKLKLFPNYCYGCNTRFRNKHDCKVYKRTFKLLPDKKTIIHYDTHPKKS